MQKLYLILLCCFLATGAIAQTKKKKGSSGYNAKSKENDKFLEKQWWIGFKAGTNLSKAVIQSYSVISPINYDPSKIEKHYGSFDKTGSQAAIEITFYIKGFSLSVQPTYRHARFDYTNDYEWMDALNPSNRLTQHYYQEQKVDHAEIPFVVKYDLTSSKLRPYVQIGGYGAFLMDASKTVTVSGTDYASGGVNEFTDQPVIVGAKDLFAKNSWGLIGGAGVNYNVGNVRVNLDIMYKYGMSNITSTKNRYSNDRLSGVGDAMDDMTLNNLAISLGCLFPMRFLSSGFKSLDR